jgi:hypothetical protein
MVAIFSCRLQWAATCAVLACAPLLAGCTTTGLLLGAAGVASDTSVTWEIVKHVHAKMTEGDAIPCVSLNSVQRALSPRCGDFVPGSLLAKDIRYSQWPECPLAIAARDPRLWPVLPELLDKGAQPEACARSPLVELSQAQTCPDFAAASPAVLRSLQWLAEADARAVHHDVVRLLSCPSARMAGLDDVLAQWLARGDLEPRVLGFGVFGALHPDYLATPFAQALEGRGHTARGGLGAFDGTQPAGFEEALRTGNWAALDWWLSREPKLVNRVPPTQGNQLPWVPLARVLAPSFVADPQTQADVVEFLMSRGANPRQKLPFDAGRSVLQYARALNSPMLPLMEASPRTGAAVVVAATAALTPGE